MHILFTGGSSFSGIWFIKELASAGHHVTAAFKRPLESYSGLRRKRIDLVQDWCQPIYNISFGDADFLNLIDTQKQWDLFCHHAADVTDYKSPFFDVSGAVANNTKNLKTVLEKLQSRGCNRVVLTGSVFEQNEGAGSDQLRAVSPYGLSKGLTTDIFIYYTSILKMKLGKFVIPNPFGPYEEGRFTTYLIQTWLQGKTATVNTPYYIRDNIPVSLLAKGYARFADRLSSHEGFEKINPSGYVESQGAFTSRFAQEMNRRLNIPCLFELKSQQDFNEPKTRINTDVLNWQQLGWHESKSWDELADYYQSSIGS